MSNLFESTGKAVRGFAESFDDASQLFLNSVWDHSPGVYLVQDPLAKPHSDDIKQQIDMSLRHGDTEGAAEQMRRELYFCSTIDSLAGSKNELAARAGLKAIEKGLPPLTVMEAMDHATDDPTKDGLYSKESDVIDAQLKQYQDRYEADPAKFCHQRVKLHHQITEATKNHTPINPKDQCELAMYDLAFTDLKAKAGDRVVEKFYLEAKEMLKAAKKAGADTAKLDKIADRVGSHLQDNEVI